MITEYDLKEAIAELQGRKSPTSSDCIKLAAYYIILNNLSNESGGGGYMAIMPSYSRAEPQKVESYVDYSFTNQALRDGLQGKTIESAYELLDEIMNAVSVTNPELYKFAVRKVNA